jgi:Cys-tRNA synthase (O-phospho-L-seryl-tRNA:Cys-tRNA synthase)
VLADYTTLLTLARPEWVPLPDVQDVVRARSLIRHAADVPVVLSALQSQPDWLLTHNTAHFTPAVAARTGLRIATPRTFFQTLARGFG